MFKKGNKVLFSRSVMEFVGTVEKCENGFLHVNGVEVGCAEAKCRIVKIKAVEYVRLLSDSEWGSYLSTEPGLSNNRKD